MPASRTLRSTAFVAAASIAALALPTSPAGATSLLKPINGLASATPAGQPGNHASGDASLSTGGRFIAFTSSATDLVAGDTNGKEDVFVRDTLTGTTVLASQSSGGAHGNGDSDEPSISPNGRYLAFRSTATNLVTGDSNAVADVFLRDLVAGTTIRASVRNDGSQSTGGTVAGPSVTADGEGVLFESTADQITTNDSNGKADVFIRLLDQHVTERVSVTSTEAGIATGGYQPAMSSNGRYVVFTASTGQIDALDVDTHSDIYLRDRTLGTTEKVSFGFGGSEADGTAHSAVVSDDGRYVTFPTSATNMFGISGSPAGDNIYRKDRQHPVDATQVDINDASFPTDGTSSSPSMSADDTKVVFSSAATDLVDGDDNGYSDVFLRNLTTEKTTLISTKSGTTAPIHGATGIPDISPDGTAIGYQSLAPDAFPGDANAAADVFWRGSAQAGPWSDTTGLIQQSIGDFTGVHSTIGQVVTEQNRVLEGLDSTPAVVTHLAHGTFDDDLGPVTRLYWAFFHRLPDPSGLTYWVKKHAGGMTLRKIADQFAKSSEFHTKYGNVSNTAFVTLVYQNVLERQPDAAGLAHWVGQLQAGTIRGEMMVDFSESSEGIRKMRGETDTVLLYEGLIRRLPTKVEFTNAVALLEGGAGQPTEVLAATLITSSAYALRFG